MYKRKYSGRGRSSRPVLVNQLARILRDYDYKVASGGFTFECPHWHWFQLRPLLDGSGYWKVRQIIRWHDAKGNPLPRLHYGSNMTIEFKCSTVDQLVLKLINYNIIKINQSWRTSQKKNKSNL